jgi:hypothetical protein
MFFKPLLLCSAVVLLAMLSATAQAANAEPMDLEPETLAKLAHERAKASRLSQKSDGVGKSRASDGLPASPAACGAVNIGNVIGSGRPGFQPREITVVITGDVINANNKCR